MRIFALFILLIFLISACSEIDVSQLSDDDLKLISEQVIVCNFPYMRLGIGCCLDTDNNSVCDKDERKLSDREVGYYDGEEDINGTFSEVIESSSIDVDASILVSNSKDWQEVYSLELFGNLRDVETTFLISKEHADILHFSLPDQAVQVVSSKNKYFVQGYATILQARGIKEVQQIEFSDINIDLARNLPSINKFILVNDDEAADAIVVAPFAVAARYYVLFVDQVNPGNMMKFIEEKNPEHIILYGSFVNVIYEFLEQWNTERIDNDNEFDNNIIMVEKYLLTKPADNVFLTSGTFLEKSMLDGSEPVLLIGEEEVPEEIMDYLKTNRFKEGILVGNELIGSASLIKRRTDMNIFVKFAQASRNPEGDIDTDKIVHLDRFEI